MAAARPEHLRRNAPAAGRPAPTVLPGLAGELRGLADGLHVLEPAQVVAKLEPHALRADTLRAVQ
jgi:hypothetical protein